jgi:signal transduction histidine kinase
MSVEAIKSILLVDDNPADVRLLRECFSAFGTYDIGLTHVRLMGDAERHLSKNSVDLILLDLRVADADGLAAIRRARVVAPRVPVVVLTDLDDDRLAEQALQEGAQDYHVKGQIKMPALLRALNYAIERKRRESLKDEYIATVSHELRAPLTSMAGSLGLLLEHWGGHLPDAAARLVAIAQTSSQRLIRLVDDILDIERVETTSDAGTARCIEIGQLLEQAIDGSRGLAERYGVRVRLDIALLRGEVKADPDRLVQVLINLLSNAIKVSPRDGEVVVAAEMNERCVRISVRDQGAGIPADLRPHIFERFAQGHGTYPRQRGSGLGLSIVKTIVGRLGGAVWFDDATGGGTIFYVDLPALGLGEHTSISKKTASPHVQYRASSTG